MYNVEEYRYDAQYSCLIKFTPKLVIIQLREFDKDTNLIHVVDLLFYYKNIFKTLQI